jgi:hypothetical protein
MAVIMEPVVTRMAVIMEPVVTRMAVIMELDTRIHGAGHLRWSAE